MRPSRLVLISAIALFTLPASSAMAQFPLPGIFGRVLGHVLPHRHWHRHYYPTRHYATRTPDEREHPAANRETRTPANETNASTGVFWPQLGDDLTDYVLWPSGSDDQFWAHGYNDIVMGALRPENRESARASAASAQTTGSAAVAPACESLKGSETADSVTARIESTIQPTDAQRTALNDLHGALQRAFDYVDKACPKAGPQTPTTRLDAMEDRIWAARQALLVTRAPLVKLYDSLTDEQKARLNGPSGPSAQTATRGAGCSESSPDVARMLQGRGRADPKQRAGLEALRKTSDGLAKLLASSCPATLPATPTDRLDVADRRLNSMLYAVVTLRAPLDAMSASPPPAQANPRMSRR